MTTETGTGHDWLVAWGCYQCASQGKRTVHQAPFVWLAKRRSMRHERREHGFSVYDKRGVTQ